MEAVADPEVEKALRRLECAVAVASRVGLAPVEGRDAPVVAARLEGVARRLHGLQVDVLGDIEARGLHREDGHRTARAMVTHAGNLSSATGGRRAKVARMLRAMPVVADGLRSGLVGVDQVERMARVHANPRVREQFEAADASLAVVAERLPYEQFDRYLARWEHLADEDGAADRAERDHARRDFTIRQSFDGTSYHLWGRCGSLQGTVAVEVFDAYVKGELDADWVEARARLGEGATSSDLCRTDAQRRADAVLRIFEDAAAALAERTGHQIVTDLVIDQATFERTAARLAGADPGPDPRLDHWWDDLAATTQPATHGNDPAADDDGEGEGEEGEDDGAGEAPGVAGAATMRCHTRDGRPLDPTEAVAVALISRIRRVVYGADSVAIDLGRSSRLFTGPSRLAVMLQRPTCYWPGCNVPVSWCQADHLHPWDAGGSTDPPNGAPACGTHNRHRTKGYTVTRDAAGHLHVRRPDGTEIT